LDVHPPEEPIRSWKDFLVHLATITIGLLIALALEAAVESIHYRTLVREARENLRHEMAENQKLYDKNALELQRSRERLQHDIAQLRELRSGRKLAHPDLHFSWSWDSYADAAWKSARDTGATSHMDLQAVEDYDGLYSQQSFVNEGAIGVFQDQARAAAPLRVVDDPNLLTPGEIESMLVATAQIDVRIETLQSLMKPLEQSFREHLNAP